jgi:hypothetical protein
MAATRLVSGILREIWHDAGQPGGPPQTIVTGIRLSNEQKQRVRATLVIETVVGPALASASGDVTADGFLQIRVFNGMGGTSITWTLDVQLTHSMQQALDHRTPTPDVYIAVVNGFGVGGTASAQNLAQTYDLGVAAVDQTMVVATAKGGGVVVDASTGAVTGSGPAFTVRQSDTFSTPVLVDRALNSSDAAVLRLQRARGTLAVPVALQVADSIGDLSMLGYQSGAYDFAAIIRSTCIAVAPSYATDLEFFVRPTGGAVALAASLLTLATGTELRLFTTPHVVPDVNATGSIGSAGKRWLEGYIDTVRANANVILGGATVGGGADQTVLLPNTATMPASQANQVYLGSKDWTGSPFGGIAGATFDISAEAQAQGAGVTPADTLIPIRYNGHNYVLLAIAADGG